MSKTAIITGASGQDALLLSEYLINQHDYKVYAIARRVARPESRHVLRLLEKYPENYSVISGDITDMSSIIDAIKIYDPCEFYNLAAQSHVGLSFKEPISTMQITGMGVLNCLEAIRKTNKNIRFYQASSSEMFGGTRAAKKFDDEGVCIDKGFVDGFELDKGLVSPLQCYVINEDTPLNPRSPYACAKVLGHTITRNYREAYGLFASCGILFNHESELRKRQFVTRKVTAYVAERACRPLTHRKYPTLKLGTLDFARDWGCAKDYVRGMHMMLQADEPDDFVLATGEVHTGKELLEAAFGGFWEDKVEMDPTFERPSDVKVLIGDYSKAKRVLGWEPTRTFEKLIQDMVFNDKHVVRKFGKVVD